MSESVLYDHSYVCALMVGELKGFHGPTKHNYGLFVWVARIPNRHKGWLRAFPFDPWFCACTPDKLVAIAHLSSSFLSLWLCFEGGIVAAFAEGLANRRRLISGSTVAIHEFLDEDVMVLLTKKGCKWHCYEPYVGACWYKQGVWMHETRLRYWLQVLQVGDWSCSC